MEKKISTLTCGDFFLSDFSFLWARRGKVLLIAILTHSLCCDQTDAEGTAMSMPKDSSGDFASISHWI